MATTKLLTAEDLWNMGEDSGYELIRGELRRVSPTGDEHGEIAALITSFLVSHTRPERLGTVYAAETGFVIARDPDIVLAPDVAFVSAARLRSDRDRRRFVELQPDLVVEVNSPSDSVSDVTDKVVTYLEAGVRLVWVVDPRRQVITVYEPDRSARILTTNDELDGGDVLPGFKIAVAELFS